MVGKVLGRWVYSALGLVTAAGDGHLGTVGGQADSPPLPSVQQTNSALAKKPVSCLRQRVMSKVADAPALSSGFQQANGDQRLSALRLAKLNSWFDRYFIVGGHRAGVVAGVQVIEGDLTISAVSNSLAMLRC